MPVVPGPGTRNLTAVCVSVFSTFGYDAVAYGTPLIITTLVPQSPLITIISSLIINSGIEAIGGLLGMSIVNRPSSLSGSPLRLQQWLCRPSSV